MTSSSRRLWPTLTVAIAWLAAAAPARAQTPPAYPPAAQYPTTQYPQPSPTADPPLSTGGLTPPPTSEMRPGESETLSTLERAEREDSGRGLEFVWIDAEAGYEYLSLQTFKANSLVDADVIEDNGSAYVLGAGAGVRLVFLTLGARFRLARFSDWDLWTLNGEVALHVPVGAFEPSFAFGAGYASLGAFDFGNAVPGFSGGSVDASGFDARVTAALDWYINPLLSIGAKGSFDVLVLYREAAPADSLPPDAPPELLEVYANDGDGSGFGVTITGGVAFHF
jgi:hypothetical protein